MLGRRGVEFDEAQDRLVADPGGAQRCPRGSLDGLVRKLAEESQGPWVASGPGEGRRAKLKNVLGSDPGLQYGKILALETLAGGHVERRPDPPGVLVDRML